VGHAFRQTTCFANSEIFSHFLTQNRHPAAGMAASMASEWDKERKFEIEKVSPIYLITALCVVPFGVYFLLNFLSPLIHRITAMKISEVCCSKTR
jgi:hypothetical protein